MSNSLADLNAHLFAQLERLDVEHLTPEQIEAEVTRSKAIVDVADRITANADLQLRAAKLFAEHREAILPMLPMIGRAEK
jgi:hypothetical protein